MGKIMYVKATACGPAEEPLTLMAAARPRSLQTGLTGLQDQSNFLQNRHINLHIFT
jgi:hypothetical protein